MINITVASDSPLKARVAQVAFEKVFPGEFIRVFEKASISGVPEQPMSSIETLLGAKNRLEYIESLHAKDTSNLFPSDYLISIEGGVENRSINEMIGFAYVLVKEIETGNIACSKTAEFRIPKPIVDIIIIGGEISPAAHEVFGKENCKNDGGLIALFTDNILTREEVNIQAAIFAINELKHPEWFFV